MIASLEIHIWLLALVVPLYWGCSGRFAGLRLPLIILVSVLLLYSLSPLIPVTIGGYYAAIVALFGARRAGWLGPRAAKAASWLCFAPLAAVQFVQPQTALQALFGDVFDAAPDARSFAYLGLSYTAIRAFLVLRQALAAEAFRHGPALAALTFFGSFAAGPIAGGEPFHADRRAERLHFETAVRGVSRIGWGVAMLLVFTPAIRAVDLTSLADPIESWAGIYRAFLALYFDFAGYTDIAIGIALLFGARLPENFRLPLLARSIQEFWQRWHLSLSAFIGTWLFKPLVRKTGNQPFAIFAAFVLVGLWHRVSWTYLIWGVGHGAALAGQLLWRKRFGARRAGSPHPLAQAAGWLATITYVALLSAIANSPSLGAAAALVASLIGL